MPLDPQDAQSRRILIWAGILSVVLHIAILVAVAVLDLGSTILAIAPKEDSITFRFEQPKPEGSEPNRKERSALLGELAPPRRVVADSELGLPAGGLDLGPETRHSNAIEEPSMQAELSERENRRQDAGVFSEPADAKLKEPQPGEADAEFASAERLAAEQESAAQAQADLRQDEGLDFPKTEEGLIPYGATARERRSVPSRDPGRVPTRRPGFDLDEALESFGDGVRKAQDDNPRAAPPNRLSQFVPDPNDIPPNGVGFGMFEFDSRDYDWTAYSRHLYVELMRTWYPQLDRTVPAFERWGRENELYLDARVTLRFTIQKDGDVTGIRILKSSDCEPLDDSGIHTLQMVRLQPLPAEFPRDQESLTLHFVVQAWTQQMGAGFRYLKRIDHWTMKRSPARSLENDGLNPYSSAEK